MVNNNPVPPTPYYYGLRAEWFRNEADKALSKHNMEKYYYLYNRYIEYELLAGQIPLEKSDVSAN